MPDYLLLTHRLDPGAGGGGTRLEWGEYIARLQATGQFQGGSTIGDGLCARKDGVAPPITGHLSGFMRLGARDLDGARALLEGNPVYENGGTIEIRELRTGE